MDGGVLMRKFSLIVLSAVVATVVGVLVYVIDSWQRILGRLK